MDHKSCLFDFVTKPDGPAPMREMVDTAKGLSEELIEYEGTVRQAFVNFRGVLLFYLEGPEKALECFQQVLRDDKNNINGIKNVIYVLNKIKADSDVKMYETKLQCILDSVDKNKAQLFVSRFYAELGFALSFDFNFGPETTDQRFLRGIDYFRKALETPTFFGDQAESDQWHFFAARVYHRLYDDRLKRQPYADAAEQTRLLEHCIGLLLCVLNNCTSAVYTSQALCLLGTMFFKMPEDHRVHLESFINNNGLEREFEDPGHCFQRARDLCPNNAKLTCRHARMFITHKFWNFTQARSLLDQSIAMDETELNWLALSTRAKAHKRQYQRCKKEFPKSIPPQQLLEQAKEDLERSLTLKPLPFERMELAEVCHLLAKIQTDQEKSKFLFREAMCHFQQALDGLKGGKPQHVLHFKWGRCLRDCREIRGAIECFKTSLECDDTRNYPHIHNFSELMALMLSECRKGKASVQECAFWLDYAIRKYGDHTACYIEKLSKSFPAAEMFDVCMKLVQTRKLEAAIVALPKLITGLKTILRLTGRSINIPVVKKDLEAAQNSLQSIKGQMVPKETSPSKFEAQLNKARNNKSKKFDFCVLYSDEDREWVCCSMIPKLEDWYRFRGFISDRDIQFGTETTDELGDGIENSVCTVVVISPDFLEDDFLRKMLLCAFQEDDHHILLFQYTECEVPSKVTKLSQYPIICFPDWHALIVKLEELSGIE